jgi:hypothetical protein
VGNGFPKCKSEGFVPVLKRFIGQKEHFEIPFDPEKLPEIGQAVKKTGTSAADMDWNDIAPVLS